MTKMEDDQNVRLEKPRVTDKNGPQIWTRGKILIKRRNLDNGAILQILATKWKTIKMEDDQNGRRFK